MVLAVAQNVLGADINVESLELAGDLRVEHRVDRGCFHAPDAGRIVGQPHRAVDLRREIEGPLVHGRGVLHVEHAFESAGHRPFHQPLVGQCHLGVGVAEGGRDVEALQRIDRKVDLPGVGVGFPVGREIVDGDQVVDEFHVDDDLLVEVGPEVVEAQVSVGVFRTEGQIEGDVAAPGPGVFEEIEIVFDGIRLSRRENAEVVGKDVGGAIAAATQRPEGDPVSRRPAKVGARSEEPAVERVVLQVDTAHEGQGLLVVEGVFAESRNRVLLAAEALPGIVVEVVELPGGAELHFVHFVDLVLVDEVGEGGVLGGVVVFQAEERLEFVVVEVGDQGDVGAVLLVEGEADLEVAVDALVFDVRAPDLVLQVVGVVLGGVHLAAEAVVVEEAAAEADLHAARGVVEPAAGKIELQVLRLVAEAVLVVVHLVSRAAHVGHVDHAPLFVELDGRSDVGLEHGVGTAVELDEERGLVGGLAVFHVDLAGDGFQAVDHRRGSFGDLDALEPLAGDERHAERRGDAPHHGPVLVEHLGVGAREAQELDLAGAGHGVGIADRDAGGVFEALGQGAAGHLAQAGGRDDLGLDALELGHRGLLGGDLRLAQVVLAAEVELRFCGAGFDHHGVAGVSHVGGDQRGAGVEFQGEFAVFVGLDELFALHVVDLGEGQGLRAAVGLLVIDIAVERLAQDREGGEEQE